ncbi:hypothetical protein RJG79_11085 [Mycoplasmatota bacterium WC44]
MGRAIIYLMFVLGIYSSICIGILKIGIGTRKVQRLVRSIGELPTRIFHIVAGILLLYLAIRSM